jgi:hypothetical protein
MAARLGLLSVDECICETLYHGDARTEGYGPGQHPLLLIVLSQTPE